MFNHRTKGDLAERDKLLSALNLGETVTIGAVATALMALGVACADCGRSGRAHRQAASSGRPATNSVWYGPKS
jgi:hypothetical protein